MQQLGPAGVQLAQLEVEEPQLLGRWRNVRHAWSVVRVTPHGMSARTQNVLRYGGTRCLGQTRPMDWSHYRFRSLWVLPAPPAAVYDLLEQAEDYPRWWPQVREVTKLSDTTGVDHDPLRPAVRHGLHRV